ncbi:MAG: helix-turn-helix transcriptional regulator, partial [Nitrosopumilus sp.]
TNPPVTNPPVTNPPVTNPEQLTIDVSTFALIGAPIAAAAAGVIIAIKKKQTKSSSVLETVVSKSKSNSDTIDTETIFSARPEMREDDKEIIKFISENGGQALESELRKKFLQPRTTMWRAVKRLERQGIIEITKKDLQNLVKLKKELEEEE